MAVIKKDGGYNALPISYKRGNPIPLDKSSIWYDYDLMVAYATTDPTAYVGQILGLVDEANNTAAAYIILNSDGELQQVGNAILVDNSTIILSEDGVLGLKDFGIKFYKYIPEVTNEETGEKIPAHYDIQLVDDNNPWLAGLEPRAVVENGEWVIGWYEPNPTTIEGINNQVSAIQGTVSDLVNEITDLNAAIGAPADVENNISSTGIFAELDKKANINDIYSKTEIDNQIANAVANADHLKRIKVDSIEDIDTTKENCIFMVPNGLTENDDKYNEYMVIDGVIEKVGDWEVSLEGYVTNDSLATTLSGYATTNNVNTAIATAVADKINQEQLNTALNNYATLEKLNTELENKITNEDLNNTLNGYATINIVNAAVADKATIEALNAGLAKKVDIKDGYGLIPDDALAKLNNLPASANENVIDTVEDTEFNLVNKHLSLKAIDASKILNLGTTDVIVSLNNTISTLNTKVETNSSNIQILSNNLSSLSEEVNTNKLNITTLNTRVDNVDNKLNNYVLVTEYTSKIKELEDKLTWHDIEIQL